MSSLIYFTCFEVICIDLLAVSDIQVLEGCANFSVIISDPYDFNYNYNFLKDVT